MQSEILIGKDELRDSFRNAAVMIQFDINIMTYAIGE